MRADLIHFDVGQAGIRIARVTRKTNQEDDDDDAHASGGLLTSNRHGDAALSTAESGYTTMMMMKDALYRGQCTPLSRSTERP